MDELEGLLETKNYSKLQVELSKLQWQNKSGFVTDSDGNLVLPDKPKAGLLDDEKNVERDYERKCEPLKFEYSYYQQFAQRKQALENQIPEKFKK